LLHLNSRYVPRKTPLVTKAVIYTVVAPGEFRECGGQCVQSPYFNSLQLFGSQLLATMI
jgi:hypothetical protein